MTQNVKNTICGMDSKILGMLIPVAVYLAFTLPNLHLPAPYTDELFFAPSAMEMAGYDLPQDYKSDIGLHEVKVAGRSLPVMALQYIGMLRAYFQGLVFLAAGPSLAALRVFHLLLGVLGILATYAFAGSLFRNQTAGVLAALFLAFDPTYILSTRMDSVGFSLSMALRSFSLLLLLSWWRSGFRGSLYLMFLLAGLALSDKAIALWFYAGLFLAGLCVYPRQLFQACSRLSWKDGLVVLAAFVAGGYIFFAWYGPRFGHFFGTWIWGSIASPANGDQSVNFFLQLSESTRELLHLIAITFSGNLRPDIVDVLQLGGDVFRCVGSVLLPIGFSVIIFLPMVLILSPFRKTGRKVLLVMSAGIFIYLQIFLLPLLESPFDLALDYHHLLVGYPLFQIAAAGVLSFLLRALCPGKEPPDGTRYGQKNETGIKAGVRVDCADEQDETCKGLGSIRSVRWIRATALCSLVAGLILFPFGISSLRVVKVHQTLKSSGGKGYWSDAMYDVVSFLESKGNIPVLCNDWGINRPLLFLSRGRIRTISPFHRYIGRPGNGSEDPEYLAYLEAILKNSELLIVGHAKTAWIAFDGPQEALEKVVHRTGRTLVPVVDFSSRDGIVVYRVWSLGTIP